MLIGGKPLDEPIVGYASFVMNNMEQIQQVMDDYHSGKMGTI
jgi:redox-sensitive bicupin YhaK (pirin superfamily)